MDSKQKAALNTLLDEVPYSLNLYVLSEFSEEDHKYAEMLESNLYIIEVFIKQKEAQAVAKLIRKLIHKCNNLADEGGQDKHHKEYVTIFKGIMEQGENLRAQIEKA